MEDPMGEAHQHQESSVSSTVAEVSVPSTSATPSAPPTASGDPSTNQVPKLRPKPPKKGILKPPRQQPPKTLFSAPLRQARDLLGTFNPRAFGEVGGASEEPSLAAAAGTGGALGGTAGAWAGSALRGVVGKLTAAAGSSTSTSIPDSPQQNDVSVLPGSPTTTTLTAHTTSLNFPSSPSTSSTTKPLKRASFLISTISLTYPINNSLPPSSPSVSQAKLEVERKQREKLRHERGREWWNEERVLGLWERAVKTRGGSSGVGFERVFGAVRDAAQAENPAPRVLKLSGIPLSRDMCLIISDLLAVNWGFNKLLLDGCDLGDESIKPILHSLLVSGHLPYLSLANNKRIRQQGWKLLGVFLKKAKELQYLDLSENVIDKKGMDFILVGIGGYSPQQTTLPNTEITSSAAETIAPCGLESESSQEMPPEEPEEPLMPCAPLLLPTFQSSVSTLQTLRLDASSIRNATLESLAHAIRGSGIKNLSLRRNRIAGVGGVGVAIMIKDYPDVVSTMRTSASTDELSKHTPSSSLDAMTTTTQTLAYSPYENRRARLAAAAASQQQREREQQQQQQYDGRVPQITTSATGGVTTASGGTMMAAEVGMNGVAKMVRSLHEDAGRLESLVILDLKGNEIKSGVTYIAQVLKRNRTLKVLNLSENKIDVQGLVALAEALKYNSTLETLELNSNPCSGSSLEGITALRTAFTLNARLKRLYLSDTSLSTSAAIALAEFLPEARRLVHLDLTGNFDIELGGIMALAVGLRQNEILRCLDLNIPFNDERVAELSQDILQSCIRNTNLALSRASGNVNLETISGPIEKSSLQRAVREAEQAHVVSQAQATALEPAGRARTVVYQQTPDQIATSAKETNFNLEKALDAQNISAEVLNDLVELAKVLKERLGELAQTAEDERLQVLLYLNDELSSNLARSEQLLSLLESANLKTPPATPTKVRHMTPSPQATGAPVQQGSVNSPFSIADDSDSDDDSEERVNAIAAMDEIDGDADELTSPAVLSGGFNGSIAEDEVLAANHRHNEIQLAMSDLLGDNSEMEGVAHGNSPLDQVGKNWVEEEGEVFRKGHVLLDEDDDQDVDGEVLKQELLSTEVERAPKRTVGEDDQTVPSIIGVPPQPDV